MLFVSGCASFPHPVTAKSDVAHAAAPAASASHPVPAPAPVQAPAPALPAVALTPDLLFKSLLAEIALQRSEFNIALPMYLELARTTHDPRYARRATEVAVYAHDNQAATEAAELWAQTDPGSSQAAQMVAGAMIAAGNLTKAEPYLVRFLEEESANRPEALLRLMRLLSRGGDRSGQLALVQRVTEPYLDIPEAHFVRAQAALVAGDQTQALDSLRHALKLRPNWEPAALFEAQIEQQTDVNKAIETLRHFSVDNPGARDARMQYARLLAGEKRYAEARDAFASLLHDYPDNADVARAVALLSVQLKDFKTARTQFEKLAAAGGRDADLARFYLGQMAEEEKHVDDALRWYGTVESGEYMQQARVRGAHLLMQAGRIDEARAMLHAMGERDPSLKIQATVAEAQLLRDAGKPEQAYSLLEDALAVSVDDPDLLYEAALAAERVDKLDVMEAHLRRLIVLKPESAHAYNALGYSLADHGRKLEEAQSLIAKALQLAPEDPFILDSMGWVLYRRGDLDGALQNLQRAFGLRADPEIAAHLGEVLWKLGRRDDAQRTWTDAQRAHPTNELLANTIRRFKP